MSAPEHGPGVPTPGPISLRMIEELRDAVLALAQAMRSLQFECDRPGQQRAQQQVDECLQRIQAKSRGPA